MTENEAPRPNNGPIIMKLLVVLGWTGLCALIWFVWFGAAVYNVNADPKIHDTDLALSAAGCVITGCTGGIWLVGLLVITLLILILRR